MKLEQLLEGVPFTLAQGSLDTEISDIIYDSRKAAPGLLFVCIVGTQRDSHEFAADCAAKGVSALVIQHDIDLSAMPGVAVVKVESSRYAMALMSANLFGNPSQEGTNKEQYPNVYLSNSNKLEKTVHPKYDKFHYHTILPHFCE